MGVKVRVEEVPGFSGKRVIAEITSLLDIDEGGVIMKKAFDRIAEKYADEWIKEHLPELYSKIDASAVANIILMEAAKTVKNNIMENR